MEIMHRIPQKITQMPRWLRIPTKPAECSDLKESDDGVLPRVVGENHEVGSSVNGLRTLVLRQSVWRFGHRSALSVVRPSGSATDPDPTMPACLPLLAPAGMRVAAVTPGPETRAIASAVERV